MRAGTEKRPSYLYTIYRNSDDALIALDVGYRDAARIMGVKPMTLTHLFTVRGGVNQRWTVTRMRVSDIEAEIRS